MKAIKGYLRALAQMFGSRGSCEVELYKTALKALPASCEVLSYKSDPEIESSVESFRKCVTEPQIKQCYSNSFELMQFDQNFEYVLGYALAVIPIPHAWSFHRPTGTYIDLTAEIALEKEFDEYAPLLILNQEQLSPYIQNSEYIPDLFEICNQTVREGRKLETILGQNIPR